MMMLCPFYSLAQSQESTPTIAQEKRIYFTKSISQTPPTIDGVLDDPVWENVEWGGDFIQRQPYEREAPSQKTNFKILYDAKNLYIAYRCHDTDPDKIVKRLSRRDGFEGDWIEVNIDSYHDLRSAFSFTITAAGVKGDEFISNDGSSWDSSWDPIWFAKSKIDEKGWTAEIRIPLSQLRFPNKEEHIWGIQFTRRDFRMEERSVWQFIPRNSQSWVSSFGELHGIRDIKPQKQLELQPYVVAQVATSEVEPDNPFATGIQKGISTGVDGKIGVTSDLTVDFTINPDFGQVEADPSAIALDGFQIFFQERRPFFVEGRNIYDFRLTQSEAGGPFGQDALFYSRRIGGAPHGYPDLTTQEFADVPSNTTILGAAKFSGKTQNGLSIGILESITQKEYAEIDNLGERRKETVEPLTNYFVGRLQQDYRAGNTQIGGMFTAVNRELEGTPLDFLHRSAYSGGLDFSHRWKEAMWYVAGDIVASSVSGSKEAITNTQERFEHSFQRIDAPHLSVDTSLTSLSGFGGNLKIGKVGNGKKFNFEGGLSWRSPGLEINDIGFLRSTDEIIQYFWANYRLDEPFSIFRSMRFNYNHWLAWDFSGLHTFHGWNVNGHANFKNNWNFGTGLNYFPYNIETKALRGGPNLRQTKGLANWTYLSTDSRKKVQVFFNMFHNWGLDSERFLFGYSLFFNFQPLNTLAISIGPNFNNNRQVLQYVENITLDETTTTYLNASLAQKTLSMTANINYTINPNLTIQYYGSPFISRGRYSDFKYITNPTHKDFYQRFEEYPNHLVQHHQEEEKIVFLEEGTGNAQFSIDDPDFNFMQFRSNLILRWEYIPGSEIFLVWSQGNTNSGNPEDQLIPSLTNNLFKQKAENIFLVKYTYRFRR